MRVDVGVGAGLVTVGGAATMTLGGEVGVVPGKAQAASTKLNPVGSKTRNRSLMRAS